jgi:hypothetical protein
VASAGSGAPLTSSVEPRQVARFDGEAAPGEFRDQRARARRARQTAVEEICECGVQHR